MVNPPDLLTLLALAGIGLILTIDQFRNRRKLSH
jgi:hypothetical protein